MYKVNDKLWVIYNNQWGGKDGHECMVTKVGRKWIYFTTTWHQCENTVIGRIQRFHIETRYVDNTLQGRVWPSREAYTQSQLQNKEWAGFQEFIRTRCTLPDADYLAKLSVKLAEIINHAETQR